VAFIDIDSMQKRVCGRKKHGAAFGHTKRYATCRNTHLSGLLRRLASSQAESRKYAPVRAPSMARSIVH
jgi:hypothetical protein